ncbi:MAG: AMP-binding protein [Planctomycetales bacterium]|nr:AMP-binding protein [Planctomycetales bacterium]NIM09044.1 AMP-binding protein [Planctomycetales bacterium]NIN08507.1 AMP-binding protein [Planctomycetales bacterium]NIN77641.1 AMP-binding protein [Planctomycetales bacterium]NIO34804.1 AMP-binding protein [Planctomycetales bacterium]
MNLYEKLVQTARQQPDHPAVVCPDQDEVYTYAQLCDMIDEVAAQLAAAGVSAGECVGLHAPSGLNYIVVNYALWRCGACVVPIPVELADVEKQALCERIRLEHIVSRDVSANVFHPAVCGPVQKLADDNLLFPVRPLRDHPAGFADVNAAFIRFSSGTTGDSKGVVLSHETILDRIHAANDGMEICPQDRVIWLLSMSYHFAVSIVAYLTFGATTVICPRKTRLGSAIVDTTARYQGTIIYGSPSHYLLMAADRSGQLLSHLRLAISTASALSSRTAAAFRDRFGIPLTQAYGIIEVGLPCINLLWADQHVDAVGKLLPAYDLKLVDLGLGKGLKEIHIRGQGLLDAYYDPWRTRDRIMPDGWFATGDLGELDSEGCLFIRGRSKEMINVGGMKYFPQEVEAVLESHPAVQEAAVYAHRSPQAEETGRARVMLKPGVAQPPGEQDLRRYCARRVTYFKVPERIFFVATLPRTGSGKPLRRGMPIADDAAAILENA